MCRGSGGAWGWLVDVSRELGSALRFFHERAAVRRPGSKKSRALGPRSGPSSSTARRAQVLVDDARDDQQERDQADQVRVRTVLVLRRERGEQRPLRRE